MSEENSESDVINVSFAKVEAQLCEYCDKPFDTNKELKIHMISHNIELSEDEVAICDNCSKVFDSMESLNFHINDAHQKEDTKKVESPMNKSKDFEAAQSSPAQSKKQEVLCDKCFEFFDSKEKLNLHDRFVHQKDTKPSVAFQCKECSFSTNDIERLQFHLAILHDICFFCIETWPQHQKVASKGVFYHLKQAHNFEILCCKVCDYATTQKDSFIEHENSHTSDKFNTGQEDLQSVQNCTPEFDSETLLSPKAAEKCRESAASTPSSIGSYDLKRALNIIESRKKFNENNIAGLREENKKLADLVDEKEKLNKKHSSPKVIIVPPSSIVTRQAAKSPKGASKMIGNLENLEEKQREENRLKLAQKNERKQARALEKEKNKGTNSLFEQMQKDPILSRFNDDDWSENDVDNLTPQKTPNTTRKSSSSASSFKLSDLDSSTDGAPTPKKKAPANTVHKKIEKKSPTKPKKKIGCDEIKAKKKPFECYVCKQVFKIKSSVRLHFIKKHPDYKYDRAWVFNAKFKCFKCSTACDTYGKMMAHFEKMHPSDVCNPQKVLIGTSKKSAAALLQLKYGAPPAAIVKELKSFQKIAKKSVPTKKVIQDYECEVCKYKQLDLSIV